LDEGVRKVDQYINKEFLMREVESRLQFMREENGDYDHYTDGFEECVDRIESQPIADVVEIDKVAEMLRLSFNDDCACNFNGNDEWLWEKCKYAETDCPTPTERLGCWKEFVTHFIAKMDGKGDTE
jgi:hypothetical protein